MRVFPQSVLKLTGNHGQTEPDLLAVEEPLSVRLDFQDSGHLKQIEWVVTMRTPGHDEELVSGLLLAEGMIKTAADIQSFRRCPELSEEEQPNRLLVRLRDGIVPQLESQQRYAPVNSSCGVCGKTMLGDVCPPWQMGGWAIKSWNSADLWEFPDRLRENQIIFSRTGGLHGAGLFNRKGELVLAREDIGRHNALDKVIGAALHKGLLPLKNYVLVLSGRIGFELVQKSLMGGCPVLLAVGAPSSLAVQLASAHHQTLLGFVKKGKANIYTQPGRIQLPATAASR